MLAVVGGGPGQRLRREGHEGTRHYGVGGRRRHQDETGGRAQCPFPPKGLPVPNACVRPIADVWRGLLAILPFATFHPVSHGTFQAMLWFVSSAAKMSKKKSQSASVVFEDAIVFYGDLLGFSNQVETVVGLEGSQPLIDRLNQFAGEFVEDSAMHHFFGRKYWVFSDSMVAVWDLRSEAAATMTEFDAILHQLSGLAIAQARLMIDDRQLIRGGVGRGWFREDNETVVSPALVQAARLEKAIDGPFIGVHPALYAHYMKHTGRGMYADEIDPVHTLFISPSDYTNQQPALDYFSMLLGEIDLNNAQRSIALLVSPGEARDKYISDCAWANKLAYVRQHRQVVVDGLASTSERVRMKYEALRQHHNRRVSENFTEPGLEI